MPLVPLHPVNLVRLPRIRLISQDWVKSSLFSLTRIKLKDLANFPVCSFAFVNLRKVRIAPLKSEAHLCFFFKKFFQSEDNLFGQLSLNSKQNQLRTLLVL